MKILVALGTRPEAVKLAPVILALKEKGVATRVLFSGQHPALTLPVLSVFGIQPDILLPPAQGGFALTALAGAYVASAGEVIAREQPDMVLVQGDTTTAFAVALAAYYNRCPVGHVEAGLRTHNPLSPFPEENHRRMIAVLSSLHFAPSVAAENALLAEGIAQEAVTVTGNTVIDALQWILKHVPNPFEKKTLPTGDGRPYILVTAHRRENFEKLHEQYFSELNALAGQLPQAQVIFVMHPNPHVRVLAERGLTEPNIFCIEPLDYSAFLHLMRGAAMIITDSGGIQEEAAFFGTPTLVIREQTERKELLAGGNMIVVGTEAGKLSAEGLRLMTDEAYHAHYSRVNLSYGTGDASDLIVERIARWNASAS